ncbi:hypothetical protein JOM56_009243 [Amanita muscaria]
MGYVLCVLILSFGSEKLKPKKHVLNVFSIPGLSFTGQRKDGSDAKQKAQQMNGVTRTQGLIDGWSKEVFMHVSNPDASAAHQQENQTAGKDPQQSQRQSADGGSNSLRRLAKLRSRLQVAKRPLSEVIAQRVQHSRSILKDGPPLTSVPHAIPPSTSESVPSLPKPISHTSSRRC